MNIEEYKYLWDGSEPGWVLQRHDRTEWFVLFQFKEAGPSKEEIAKIHRLLPELQRRSLPEAYKLLKGNQSFRSVEPLGNIEANELKKHMKESDLNCQMEPRKIESYLPVFKESKALIIEDDAMSEKVAKRMIEAGVPVIAIHSD